MNKQEALEQLKWLRDKSPLYSNDKDFTEPLDMAISALEHQLTNRWIPVSERLPLPNAYHTIYATLRYKDDGARFSTKLMWENGKLKWFNGRQISDKYELVAWQKEYMPEPYKEAL